MITKESSVAFRITPATKSHGFNHSDDLKKKYCGTQGISRIWIPSNFSNYLTPIITLTPV